MPDSKITALTSISTSTDPANDPLVIVDVSDTSMAATGTTKKVTLNQLLGASGTATLASATITGDLTVRTNQLVVNSSGSFVGKSTGGVGIDGVQLLASGFSGFSASGTTALFVNRNTSDGTVLQLGRSGASAADFGAIAGGGFTVGLSGSEWMRLNANGLGVGASPSFKFHVQQTLAGTASAVNPLAYIVNNGSGNTAKLTLSDAVTTDGNITLTGSATAANRLLGFGINGVQQMVLDGNGNLGIGVQPSAWSGISAKVLEFGNSGSNNSLWGNGTNDLHLVSNAYFNGANWIYNRTASATRYNQLNGSHAWYTAPSGTAGNAITFTQAMTLDASGRLLVGPTSANTSGGVLQLSSGITFPATQVASSDANTLDDYEEGTWTPNVGGTATYTTQTGRYVKIGNRVFITLRMTINTIGTGDDYRISGLPFQPAAMLAAASVGFFANLKISANFISGYASTASSVITMTGTTAASANITNGIGVFGNGSDIVMSCFYEI